MISTTKMDVLVDARWIAAHLEDRQVRIVEVDVSPATYNQGHIPGAVLWNAYSDLRDGSYRTVPQKDFESLLARSGIDPRTTVVFYGYGALLGFWLLQANGHRAVRLLNGNRDEWTKQGGQWSTDVPTPAPAAHPLPAEDGALLATRADVETALADAGSLVLDVRSDAEYSGERFWPSGATEGVGRAGHIPGAVHVPIDALRDESGVVKSPDQLRALFAGSGVSPDRKIIIYCTIGNRAALAWFALKSILGYPDVAVYHGSYVEWGKLPDTRVEVG